MNIQAVVHRHTGVFYERKRASNSTMLMVVTIDVLLGKQHFDEMKDRYDGYAERRKTEECYRRNLGLPEEAIPPYCYGYSISLHELVKKCHEQGRKEVSLRLEKQFEHCVFGTIYVMSSDQELVSGCRYLVPASCLYYRSGNGVKRIFTISRK